MTAGDPFRIAISADATAAAEAPRARPRAAARPWLVILAAWAWTRVIVFGTALVCQLTGFPRAEWRPGFGRHPFQALVNWDAHWYRAIAANGYLLIPGHHSDAAFFPLMGVLMRGLAALGLSLPLASLLIANAGLLLGVLALYELARSFVPDADARRAAVYATLFPYSFIFSMGYPEGPALAAMAWAGVAAIRGRWTTCALAAAAATLLRPEGLFVAIPVAALAWPYVRAGGAAGARAATAALAGPAALGSFTLYLWHVTGDPFAWSHAEQTWNRSFTPHGVGRAIAELLTGGGSGWLWRDAVLWAVYMTALVVAARAGVPLAWILASAAICLLPLASGSFESAARYGVLALPVFIGLATLGRRPLFDRFMWIAGPLGIVAFTFAIVFDAP